LAAVILDFDRLEDAAIGAGDSSVRRAVQACPVALLDGNLSC